MISVDAVHDLLQIALSAVAAVVAFVAPTVAAPVAAVAFVVFEAKYPYILAPKSLHYRNSNNAMSPNYFLIHILDKSTTDSN